MIQEVVPVKGLRGEIQVPGDKSISHRAVLFSSLAVGQSEISGFLPGEDCLSTVNCLRQMGVPIKFKDPTALTVMGVGLNGLKEPGQVLDAGNSGTTARLLLGVLAGQNFFSSLTGDNSLRNRPMGRVVQPLLKMGAQIFGRESGTLLPLAIIGQRLKGISYCSPVASAQLKSALLLAGLSAETPTVVTEPSKSRDHTERMLEYFGANVDVNNLTVTINPTNKLVGRTLLIPGDFSSAAFFIVAALILPQSELVIKNVGINPTRTGLITALQQMNGDIQVTNLRVEAGEPVADLIVKSSRLKGATFRGDLIPKLIDEIPALAVAALFAEGETYILDAQELRVKESDRISALAKEIKRLGGLIRELPDGLHISGSEVLKGGTECFSYNDHRIAMALAVASLKSQTKVQITDFECVAISYPNFTRDLEQITLR